MSKNRLNKILFWGGKAESFGANVNKIEANAKFICIGDALDPIVMANCPTHLEFVTLDVTRHDN